MNRRGNCHDNAVAESFFQLLKRERIRRRNYPTRTDARPDLFEYTEPFYNPTRKHRNNGMLSAVDFEIRQRKLNEAGVEETWGTSVNCPKLCGHLSSTSERASLKQPEANCI